jgi:hypothetical protein
MTSSFKGGVSPIGAGSGVPTRANLGKRNQQINEADMNADNSALAEGSRAMVPFNFTGFQIGNMSFQEIMAGHVMRENPMTAGQQRYDEGMSIFLSEFVDWAVENPQLMGNMLESAVLNLKNGIFQYIFPINSVKENDFHRTMTFYGRDFVDISTLNTRPREISFEVSTLSGTLEYAAQALMISRKRLQLPGGLQMMNLLLDTWTSNMAASLILRANYQFFNEPEYFATPMQLYPNSPLPETPPQVLELERPQFGCLNKKPLAIRDLLINASAILAQGGGRVGNLVMTRDDNFFVAQMDRSNLIREFAGDSAETNRLRDRIDSYNGVNFIEIPLIGVNLHNPLDQNIFAQPVSNGSFAWYDARVYEDVPATEYRTHMSTISFCDWECDTWHEYPLYDTIRHCFEFHPLQEDVPSLKEYSIQNKDRDGTSREGQVDVNLLIEIADRVQKSGKIFSESRSKTDGVNYKGREFMLDALLKYHELKPEDQSKESMWTPILFAGQLDERLVPTDSLMKIAEVLAVRMGWGEEEVMERFVGTKTDVQVQVDVVKKLQQMGFELGPSAAPKGTGAKAGVTPEQQEEIDAFADLKSKAKSTNKSENYPKTVGAIFGANQLLTNRAWIEKSLADTSGSGQAARYAQLIADGAANSTTEKDLAAPFNISATALATEDGKALLIANLEDLFTVSKVSISRAARAIPKVKGLTATASTGTASDLVFATYYASVASSAPPPPPPRYGAKLVDPAYTIPPRDVKYAKLNANDYFIALMGENRSRFEAAEMAYGAGDDMKGRVSYAARLPTLLRVIFLVLLSVTLTLQNLRAFAVNNIPLPLGALILRPWEMQIMHSMVATVREPIGETMIGSEGMDKLVSYRTLQDAFFIEGSIRSATKILNHRGFHILRDVRGGKRLGGKGNDFINAGTSPYAPDHWEENVLSRLGRGDLLGNRSNIAVLQGLRCEPGNGKAHFDIRTIGGFSQVEFDGRRLDFARYKRTHAAEIGRPEYVGQAVIGTVLKLAARPQPKFGPSEASFRNTRRMRQHNYVVSKTNVRMYDRYSPDHYKITQSHHMWGDQLPGLRTLESSEHALSVADHFAPGTSLFGMQ